MTGETAVAAPPLPPFLLPLLPVLLSTFAIVPWKARTMRDSTRAVETASRSAGPERGGAVAAERRPCAQEIGEVRVAAAAAAAAAGSSEETHGGAADELGKV